MDRQSTVAIELERLKRFGEAVYGRVRGMEAPEGYKGYEVADVFGEVTAVEVAIVSDEVIADVHERFMAISGPTDVITFEHGEIVISADTAARQALEHEKSCNEEIALYIVHGLLHLRGYDDRNEVMAAEMHDCQEAILNEFWDASGA